MTALINAIRDGLNMIYELTKLSFFYRNMGALINVIRNALNTFYETHTLLSNL